jgi:uncharacterized protein
MGMFYLALSTSNEIQLGKWTFHEISLDDKALFSRYIAETEYPANLWSSNFPYLWAESQSYQRTILWRIIDGMLVPFAHSNKDTLYLFCLPFGKGNPSHVTLVLNKCMNFCHDWNGHDLTRTTVRMINDAQREFLERSPEFTNKYRLATLQGIERHYSVPKLVELRGKDFSNIRNRVNKFRLDNPGAQICTYDDSKYDELIALSQRWKKAAGQKHGRVFDGVYYKELVKNAKALDQTTLVIKLDGRIVGMISGGELPTGQSWGSVTKFDPGHPGLSETLVVEYARALHRQNPGIELMNVGSDLGTGGLREYKLKFRPVLNYKRYHIYLRS